jgi:Cof subfamily protein (haloacid dehalogenase superfamily)
MEIALCTGRRYRSTAPILEALGLRLHAVCLGGALVKDPHGETFSSTCFSPGHFAKLAGLIREQGQAVIAQCDRRSCDFAVDGSVPWNPETALYHRINEAHAEWRPELYAEERDDVLVVGSFGSLDQMNELREAIEGAFSGEYTVHVLRSVGPNAWYCEVLQRGVDKWTGLSQLAERLGVAAAQICAVGDERNDIPVLREVGLGIAMENGRDELKEIASRVVGPCDDDGLVPLLRELAERRRA